MRPDRTRVVITGMGAITPLGQTADRFWKNLVAGTPEIGSNDSLRTYRLPLAV